MRLGTWLGLLRTNGAQIAPSRLPLAYAVTFGSVLHSAASRYQAWRHGGRIAATHPRAPVFVVGHWRSGTTLLHELLALDVRFGHPDTFECFCPTDFLSTRWLFTRLPFLLPEKRPMDDMLVAWDAPQEDEFALVNLGAPSPYATLAFPNEGLDRRTALDISALSRAERRRWTDSLRWFVQAVTLRSGGRPLVLKSPTHTARLAAILEVFPDARFVHIVRDPYAVYRSTMRLWRTLGGHIALQEPTWEGLEESVLATYEALFRAFERDRALVPRGRLVEVRYEDLVADPIARMREVYEGLDLGEFDDGAARRIAAYFADRRDFRVHRYAPDPELDRVLAQRWLPHVRRFGYGSPGAGAGSSPRSESTPITSRAF
jgi:hypothetical protein